MVAVIRDLGTWFCHMKLVFLWNDWEVSSLTSDKEASMCQRCVICTGDDLQQLLSGLRHVPAVASWWMENMRADGWIRTWNLMANSEDGKTMENLGVDEIGRWCLDIFRGILTACLKKEAIPSVGSGSELWVSIFADLPNWGTSWSY